MIHFYCVTWLRLVILYTYFYQVIIEKLFFKFLDVLYNKSNFTSV